MSVPRRIATLLAALLVCALAPAAAASASSPPLSDTVNQWLPSSDGATWTYRWSDDAYAPMPTLEKYTMAKRTHTAFNLDWTTENLGNGDDAQSGQGEMGFNRADAGLINTGWSSTPPPPQFPILCANPTNCGNSLAGALFTVIWGTRGPVLQEPLLAGASWNAVGGANNDVASENHYLGTEEITVPAFPGGVTAAKVRSEVTQAGAIGDPYGSGERTVWWVRGVGPVRVLFRHTGGETGHVDLVGTNLEPRLPPSDANYLPFKTGSTAVYRWRNSKHMRKYSTQRVKVAQVVNNTARLDVKSMSGPIKVVGSYVVSSRLSGATDLAAATKAASLAKFPRLGPKSLPKSKRRHFFTPLDFMTYGFNPVLPSYPEKGDGWKAKKGSRDYTVFGVLGSSRVLGIQKVHTPAGNFNALAVRSRLHQAGYKYGTGTRTSWFAAGKGLVKLVFRHGDGSVSTVDRVR